MAIPWKQIGSKVGPQVSKHLINFWNNPGLYSNVAGTAGAAAQAGASAGLGAGGYGSGMAASELAAGAGAGGAAGGAGAAGGSSLGSMGASGMTAGSVASVAAPLIMAYLKYQAGSGVNEPKRKQYETRGAGKMLSDLMSGTKVDPNNAYQYGLKPKYLPDWLDPSGYREEGGGAARGTWTVDPRGYSPMELYSAMHRYGTGHKQSGGVGNSGYSDQQIDDMFGSQKGSLYQLLGMDKPPDWSNTTWDASNLDQPSRAADAAIEEQFASLTDDTKNDLMNRNRQYINQDQSNNPIDDRTLKDWLHREREQAEVEKLLGYKLGGQ